MPCGKTHCLQIANISLQTVTKQQTTSGQPRGIQWDLFIQLEDHDFADDLAVLSSTYSQLKTKMDRLSSFATGLPINKKKTEVMCVITIAMVSPERM